MKLWDLFDAQRKSLNKIHNKMYSDDAIFDFKITNVEEEKVLFLKLIAYNMGNKEKYSEDGETYTFIFYK